MPLKADDRNQMSGEYPYYGASGIIDHIDKYLFDETLLLLAEDGANIVNRSTPVAFLASGRFWVNNHAHVYRPKGDPVFLENALEPIDFVPFNTGTTMPKLNAQTCSSIPLYVPSKEEQGKIGDFLGTVDAKLDALRRKKSGLEVFKSGLMQLLFSQELRFVRDDGTDFPDWEEKALGELGSFSKGKGISKSDITEDGELPCIRYGEIYTHYNERITEIASHTDVSPSSLTLSQINDVIIPASGETPIDMARACCVLVPGVALGGDINIFRSPVNGEYLAYLLTNARRTEIAQMAQGNSVVHLYPAQLRQIVIPVPHPDEQRKIAETLSALDAKIAAVADQITHMETFKKGLLQQMFV
nr:restriction endonuclease subunit S [Sinirhodobacter populi]